MRQPLTPKRRAIYDYLVTFSKTRGHMPSQQEIAHHFGYRSLASVHEHLEHLERRGWITRSYNTSRGITLVVDQDPYDRIVMAATQGSDAIGLVMVGRYLVPLEDVLVALHGWAE